MKLNEIKIFGDNTRPLLSIIIPFYDHYLLHNVLHSIDFVKNMSRIEVIVVDFSSEGASSIVLNNFANSDIIAFNANIKVIHLPHPPRHAFNYFYGLNESTGYYVKLLESCETFIENNLTALCDSIEKIMEKNKKVDAIISNYEYHFNLKNIIVENVFSKYIMQLMNAVN
ncbi:hypothetical protein FACS189459_7260 [Bacilli bacterium]|nr:hypothetical protein FACS189459_7260 [Bacilli bacterium]